MRAGDIGGGYYCRDFPSPTVKISESAGGGKKNGRQGR
jgi:hypothetical protein